MKMPMPGDISAKAARELKKIRQERRQSVFKAAEKEGLLGRKDMTIGARVPSRLLERAKQQAGTQKVTELLLYALAKMALEDDFGRHLVARKGRVPRGKLAD